MVGEQVIAAAPDHPDGHRAAAEFSGRARLVGALTAGDHAEAGAEDGFSGRREVPHRNHKIHVEAANDRERGLHRAMSMPSFFNSSA